MRKFIIFLSLFFIISTHAGANFQQNKDYMQIMIDCVQRGDSIGGIEAAERRNLKIAALGLDYPAVDYGELEMLSKLIEIEAGSHWLSTEWKMAVPSQVMEA